MRDFDDEDWEKHLTVNTKWVDKFFHQVPGVGDFKVNARALSIKFSGTKQECLPLADHLSNSIESYVFDQQQLAVFKEEGVPAYKRASSFFGNTNPVVDGKYGELMLYMLVEAILKTPMVSHKLQLLTNVNDQVKGGDGIFFGKYASHISILIGESKIHQRLQGALADSMMSVDRFNKDYAASSMEHELFIARSNVSKNFSLEQAKKIYEAFKPGTEEYQACNRVHPVLLVYDCSKIDEIEIQASGKAHAEELVKEWIAEHAKEVLENIKSGISSYPDLRKVYLDFFLVPMSNVGTFKKTLFKSIHGIEFKEPVKEKKPKTPSKSAAAPRRPRKQTSKEAEDE
ncbi:DUF1837 domain-containing protein [Stutzerimonas frequens]|uniref:HamA C-terminal domain-containing protein n=1 Tax=Stutzerimonas frequens TaxID=2968969 RepID=UPI002DBEB24E|nr:DUF1837 domain-containing protein [Stutzerimonas frequens]WRW25943.1 DUF1837 domain-containing protein [Stutzerimonas frequens]